MEQGRLGISILEKRNLKGYMIEKYNVMISVEKMNSE